jgi:hypothetical protein
LAAIWPGRAMQSASAIVVTSLILSSWMQDE